MATVKDTLKQILNGYSKAGLNGYSTITASADENTFTSVVVGRDNGQAFSFVDLIVRLVDGLIVIDQDSNSKPLVDALVQAGIPRSQIILAYAGELVPELSPA